MKILTFKRIKNELIFYRIAGIRVKNEGVTVVEFLMTSVALTEKLKWEKRKKLEALSAEWAVF